MIDVVEILVSVFSFLSIYDVFANVSVANKHWRSVVHTRMPVVFLARRPSHFYRSPLVSLMGRSTVSLAVFLRFVSHKSSRLEHVYSAVVNRRALHETERATLDAFMQARIIDCKCVPDGDMSCVGAYRRGIMTVESIVEAADKSLWKACSIAFQFIEEQPVLEKLLPVITHFLGRPLNREMARIVLIPIGFIVTHAVTIGDLVFEANVRNFLVRLPLPYLDMELIKRLWDRDFWYYYAACNSGLGNIWVTYINRLASQGVAVTTDVMRGHGHPEEYGKIMEMIAHDP